MKRGMKLWIMGLLFIALIGLTACNGDDEPDPIVHERIYPLEQVGNSGVSGNITFRRESDTSTLVIVQVSGTQAGNSHPTHIHANPLTQGGPITIDLTSVDGSTGRSETLVTALDDGTPINYQGLINYNGHANIHLSMQDLATLLSQGNIGANAQSTGTGPEY